MNQTDELNELRRKVDFNTYDISVKELVSMLKDNIIDIAPDYQRQFRWDPARQSQLVESIFLGIPVPSLYMATNLDGTWELIDGVQRLSSLVNFVGDADIREKTNMLGTNLKLTSLAKLTSFEGMAFTDLSKSVQLDFLLKPLKITTLSDKSDKDVRFDLFERLNTGGIVLTNQEIRSCVYRGDFNEFLKSLAQDENFKSVVKLNKAQQADATREEYVLRFFAFLNNYENFDHSVVDFLNNYMAHASKDFNYSEGRSIFEQTFKQLRLLPNGISRNNRNATPANLYEGVAVGAAIAIREAGQINTDDVSWMNGDELRSATTDASNTLPKVKKRIEYSRDMFLGR